MKKTNALSISMKLMRNAIIGISITTLSISPFKSDSQVIRSYLQNNNVKNYSIEEVPLTLGNEFVMAGTIFDNALPSNKRAAIGKGINFMRVDALGKTSLYTGTIPNYVVSKRYDFNQYADVRCIDIVPYTNSQSLIVANARFVDPSHSGDFRYNKDLVLVLRVENASGNLLNTYELAYPTTPGEPHWGYDNIYATHAIYHNGYLFVCGYDGIETSYPNYPEYIPHNGPSCYDKRALVLKFDINGTNTVLNTRTWDYPWVNCSTTEEYPNIYDFDMALRMIPLSNGKIYVTGTTNSDFSYETRPPFPTMIPSYGSGTLSLLVDNALNTVAIRPFIEHNLMYAEPPYVGYHDGFYEQGFGAYEETVGSATGLYVFSNKFEPRNEGYGITEGATIPRMTYIDKNSLNFGKYPDIHRYAWRAIDYDWGTQVLPSPNAIISGTNRLYLAGLQYGWDLGNYPVPTAPNKQPNIINNISPFLAELEPTFTVGSPSTIGLTNTYFWHVYFNMNNTGYFKDLGGGLSNPYWATEFVANSILTTGPVFTSPSWNPIANGGVGALNHKFTRTDAFGDITTGYTDCDNSYMNAPHADFYTIDITDAWFFNRHEEDVPTVSSVSVSFSDVLHSFSYDPYCGETGYNPYYKSTGITHVNTNNEFDVYPNPANGYVFVKSNVVDNNQKITVELINMIGQQIAILYSGTANAINDKQLQLKDIAKGAYMIKISSNNETLHNAKLLVQ
ncbi:MAG: T9SS type A sorting domain-containing protein [Chitinophagales bacterium]|nr:T9SS type A sorting domain-containing protein [Chitinophagales bacterium]